MNRCLYWTLFALFFGSLLVASVVSSENLETAHFFIIYSPSDAPLANTIAETMEEARDTLTEELGMSHESPLKIRLVPHLTSGSKARYLPDRRVIKILTIAAMTKNSGGKDPPLRFIKGVLWHEYVHFLQHQAMRRFIKNRDALWFIEGTAEYFGTQRFIGQYSPEAVWKEGKSALSGGRLPTLADLNRYHATNQFPLTTYFFSSDATAFLIGKWGMEPLRQMTEGIGEGKTLSQCLSESLGIGLKDFEGQWHQDLEERYKGYIRNS